MAGSHETLEVRVARDLSKLTSYRWRREYRFTKQRKWAFDLACPRLKLAVEIDGSSHRRHARMRSDAEKINMAIAMGWRVLRYPACAVLTRKRYQRILDQINRVFCGVVDQVADAHVLTGD